MAPGMMALMRIPWRAYSTAALRVSPNTPCLLAVYPDCSGWGRNEFVDPMLTIAPPAAPGEHRADLVLQAQEGRPQVDRQDAIELLLGQVGQHRGLGLDGGAVGGARQRAELLDRGVHEARHVLTARQVGGHEDAGGSHRLHLGERGASTPFVDVGNCHPGAGPGEGDRRGPPHAPGAASDQSDAVVERARRCHGWVSSALDSRRRVVATMRSVASVGGIRSSSWLMTSIDTGAR